MSPDGNDLFVADNLGNTVTDINTVTDTAAASLPTGNSPYTCEVSPDGKQVFCFQLGGSVRKYLQPGYTKHDHKFTCRHTNRADCPCGYGSGW